MAHNTKKADFIKMVSEMNTPTLRTFRGSVYLRDGKDVTTEVEIYRASNMKETGIICSMNQAAKFRGWM